MKRALFAAALVATALPAWAEAPDTSPRPLPRDGQSDPVAVTALAPTASLRPDLRPTASSRAPGLGFVANAPEPEPETRTPEVIGSQQVVRRSGLLGLNREVTQVPIFAGETALAVVVSPRPALRPEGLEQRVRAAATRATPQRVTQQGQRGQLCGMPGLVGERLSPVVGRISGCGIAEPIRLREVNGIVLTTPATINCDTARALQTWLEDGVVPTLRRTGGGLASLRVVASYSCRTRNNQPGARLSEHSTGNAIDIAGFVLASGQEISLISGWRDAQQGPILRRLHQAACGPFGTVLGPESDRFHQDHFHFDVAGYRSGPYCR